MRETRSFEIPLCHELGSFIKYADGVQDPDFWRSGIARFRPCRPLISTGPENL